MSKWARVFSRLLRRRSVLGLAVLLLSAVAAQAQQSRVECSTVASKILTRDVAYCVILPPSYGVDKAKRYPVVYYLHGLGDNEQSLVNGGGWNVYDDLLRKKKIGEFIIVTPAGYRSFYINSHDGRFRYGDFFGTEFIPAIERKYRVARTRAQRGLLGISMGGFGALYHAFTQPRKFSVVATHMAALTEKLPQAFGGGFEEQLMSDVFGNPPDAVYYASVSPISLANRRYTALKGLSIYFDCGDNDDYGFDGGAVALDAALKRRNVAHEFHLYPGRHGWRYVMDHFPASLEFLSKALVK